MDNALQQEFWNGSGGKRWTEGQQALDRALEPFGRELMVRAVPKPGERVIDIGCGCGAMSIAVGEAVGSSGSVLGIDFSQPMLNLARERAKGAAHVRFESADASTYSAAPPVDLLVSRFGVMFFADPTAAFQNLRKMLRPGGRLAFVCWRSVAENPWISVPTDAAMPFFPPAARPDPDAPGPFAFANSARVLRILESAQFRDVSIQPFDSDVAMASVSGGLTEAVEFAVGAGPVARLLVDADATTRARVVDAVTASLVPHVRADGVKLKGAVWVVSAAA